MTAPGPAQHPRDVDLDAVRSSVDSNAVRKAVNLLVLTLWQHRFEHAVVTDAAGMIHVEVQGEVLTDVGWSRLSFKNLHLRLSSMSTERPKWLKTLIRSRIPWRWVDFVEYRIWLRRRPEGQADMYINNVPADLRFRAVGPGRIELDIKEVPSSPDSNERSHSSN